VTQQPLRHDGTCAAPRAEAQSALAPCLRLTPTEPAPRRERARRAPRASPPASPARRGLQRARQRRDSPLTARTAHRRRDMIPFSMLFWAVTRRWL
jgi:hypothetical protein